MWNILANLYGHNLGCDELLLDNSMLTMIFQLSQELEEWHESLPEVLSLRTAAEIANLEDHLQDPVIERYRLILTLRYLNLQLLLFRPVLSRSLNINSNDDNPRQIDPLGKIGRDFHFNCIKSAEDIVIIIHFVLTQPSLGKRLVGAWWFTLYYSMEILLNNPTP
jgi:hypothetical protein